MSEGMVEHVNEETGEVIDVPVRATRALVQSESIAAGAVAPWAPTALAAMSEEEFERRLELAARERDRIERIQKAVMREGVDYGVIPGTKKPTLLKPGAEILNRLARLTPMHDVTREVGDGVTAPHIRYQVVTRLMAPDGTTYGEGLGSASSWETKHRYRGGQRICPECGAAAIRENRSERYWYCWNKPERDSHGCGARFDHTDPRIVDQEAGKTENPDPHDADNTLLKMACKRADIDATLRAHAASGIFTQDLEDLADTRARADAAGRRAETRTQGNGSRPAQNGAGQRITPGAKTVIEAKARRRANELGLDDADAWSTLVSELLETGNLASLDDLPLEQVNRFCAALEKFTPAAFGTAEG